MKKIFSVLVCIILLCVLSACGKNPEQINAPADTAPDLELLETLLNESGIVYWFSSNYQQSGNNMENQWIYPAISQWLQMCTERNQQDIPQTAEGIPYFPLEDYQTATAEVLDIDFDFAGLTDKNNTSTTPEGMLCAAWGYDTAHFEIKVMSDTLERSQEQYTVTIESEIYHNDDIEPTHRVSKLEFCLNSSYKFSPFCIVKVDTILDGADQPDTVLASEITKEENGTTTVSYAYDERGRQIGSKTVKVFSNGLEEVTVKQMAYTEHGLLQGKICTTYTNGEKKAFTQTDYFYDSNSILTKIEQNENGTNQIISFYNQDGTLQCKENWMGGEYTGTREYLYDEQGRLLQENITTRFSSQVEDYRYSDDGTTVEYILNGKIKSTTKTETDSEGNVTVTIYGENDDIYSVTVTDQNGLVQSELRYWKMDVDDVQHEQHDIYSYLFDENGRVTRKDISITRKAGNNVFNLASATDYIYVSRRDAPGKEVLE